MGATRSISPPELWGNANVEEIIEFLEVQPLADVLVSSVGVEVDDWS